MTIHHPTKKMTLATFDMKKRYQKKDIGIYDITKKMFPISIVRMMKGIEKIVFYKQGIEYPIEL